MAWLNSVIVMSLYLAYSGLRNLSWTVIERKTQIFNFTLNILSIPNFHRESCLFRSCQTECPQNPTRFYHNLTLLGRLIVLLQGGRCLRSLRFLLRTLFAKASLLAVKRFNVKDNHNKGSVQKNSTLPRRKEGRR